MPSQAAHSGTFFVPHRMIYPGADQITQVTNGSGADTLSSGTPSSETSPTGVPSSGTVSPGTTSPQTASPGTATNGGETEFVRARLPNRKNREQFGQAELMLGSYHIRVRCADGVTRLGRIKGKMKKRFWIREGDIVIVTPWSFQDDKCDISYRYTPPQRDWLRRNRYI